MARSDRNPKTRPVALAAALAVMGGAHAQQTPAAPGNQADLSYTPITGVDVPLYPLAPTDQAGGSIRQRQDVSVLGDAAVGPVDRVVV
jgi:hypothetical protein